MPPPLNDTKISLSTLEELLAILIVSISTFLTKYSSSSISNEPPPDTNLTFSPAGTVFESRSK